MIQTEIKPEMTPQFYSVICATHGYLGDVISSPKGLELYDAHRQASDDECGGVTITKSASRLFSEEVKVGFNLP